MSGRSGGRGSNSVRWVLVIASLLATQPLRAVVNPGYRGLTYPERETLVLPTLGVPELNSFNGNLVIRRPLGGASGRGIPVELDLVYNSDRRLVSSPFGVGWNFSYNIRYLRDSAGDASIVWGDGRVDTFVKSGSGFTSPPGVFLTLAEPSPGDLRLTSPQGIVFRFADAGLQRVTSITDSNFNAVVLTYDIDGRLATITDPSGRSWTLAFDGQGRVGSISGGSGVIVTLTHDANNRLTGLGFGSSSETFAYNADNLITSITGRRGFVTTLTYVTPAGSPGTRLLQSVAKGGSTMSFAFNGATRTTTLTDPDGKPWTYVYDTAGRLTHLGDPLLKTATLAWDSHRDLTAFTDRNGHTRTFAYDGRGNLTSATIPIDGSTALTSTITYEPSFSRPTAVTDPNGDTFTLDYDAYGNLVKLSDPVAVGTFEAYTVDAVGQTTAITNRDGHTTTVEYDTFGNVTRILDPLGHTTRFEYDDGGSRRTKTTDANGDVTQTSFDGATRTRHVTDPRGNADASVSDANGNLVAYTDREGNTTHYTYDGLDRLTSTTDALGHADARAYDAAGNLIHYTDRRGKVWSQTFDPRGLLASRSDPLGNTWLYTYDDDGNLHTAKDAKNQVTTFAYDFGGRLVQEDYADGRRASFTYDGDGELLTARDGLVSPPTPISDFTYTYDALGREHSLRDNLMGKTVQYQYDGEGHLTQKTLVGGDSATYAYDAAGRLVTLTAFGGTSTFVLDNEGNHTSEARSNGMAVTDTYDADGELASETIHAAPAFGGGIVESFVYTRDKNGRVVQTVRETGETIAYARDALGRLTHESGTAGGTYSVTRAYDADGNWTSYSGALQGSTIAQTVTFDDAGRPTTRSTAHGGPTVVYTYAYDANGNRTSTLLPPSAPITYAYDAANRLVSMTPGPSPAVSYGYDVFDQFVQRSSAGSTLKFFYGSTSILAVTDASNSIIATFFPLPASDRRMRRGGGSDLEAMLDEVHLRALLPRVADFRSGGGFSMRSNGMSLGSGFLEAVVGGDRIAPFSGCRRPQTMLLFERSVLRSVPEVSKTPFGYETWLRAANLPFGRFDPWWRPVGVIANGSGYPFFSRDYFGDGTPRTQQGSVPDYHNWQANGFGGVSPDGLNFRGAEVDDPAVGDSINVRAVGFTRGVFSFPGGPTSGP